jgi:hypothetical protein
LRGVFERARPRPVLPAATVLGPIVFAVFANPGLTAFFDEKFESAPFSRESANHHTSTGTSAIAVSVGRWKGNRVFACSGKLRAVAR